MVSMLPATAWGVLKEAHKSCHHLLEEAVSWVTCFYFGGETEAVTTTVSTV
jgi:hypothetical protein